jgi:hypothetical protein
MPTMRSIGGGTAALVLPQPNSMTFSTSWPINRSVVCRVTVTHGARLPSLGLFPITALKISASFSRVSRLEESSESLTSTLPYSSLQEKLLGNRAPQSNCATGSAVQSIRMPRLIRESR